MALGITCDYDDAVWFPAPAFFPAMRWGWAEEWLDEASAVFAAASAGKTSREQWYARLTPYAGTSEGNDEVGLAMLHLPNGNDEITLLDIIIRKVTEPTPVQGLYNPSAEEVDVVIGEEPYLSSTLGAGIRVSSKILGETEDEGDLHLLTYAFADENYYIQAMSGHLDVDVLESFEEDIHSILDTLRIVIE